MKLRNAGNFGTVQIAANGVAQSFWAVAALMGTALGLAFVTVIGQSMRSLTADKICKFNIWNQI